jgi:dihydrofolate synthase / folylpolyglutamate synthase
MSDVSAYQNTLDFLYQKLPMFSRIGKAALKPDLTNTLKLCEALGNPERTFRSVHIAGTNGKGSVSHILAAACMRKGYKTGLYTSPHLSDFRERIRLNGSPVSKEWVVDFVAKHKQLIEDIQPSFFEITVAMAFQAFADEQVDIAIIETGLGGRLDSTNVITPLLSVITNISYDHTDLLGTNLAQIAGEKAGIIKPGVPVVIGEQHPETERIFFEHSVHKHSTLYYAQSIWGIVRTGQDDRYQYYKAVHNALREMYDLRTDLPGNYQQHNLKTALAAAEVLTRLGFSLPTDVVIASLANVKGSTGLRGRWDILSRQPFIVCDVAHNPAGLAEVIEQFNDTYDKRPSGTAHKHIVIGFVRDKDVPAALALFPKDATYYCCNADNPRALPANELLKIATEAGLSGTTYDSVAAAVKAARAALHEMDMMLVTGSFFIVGEALSVLDTRIAAQPEA